MIENSNDEFNKKNRCTRLITGFVISMVALVCFLSGGIPLFCFLMVVLFLAAKEYVQILKKQRVSSKPLFNLRNMPCFWSFDFSLDALTLFLVCFKFCNYGIIFNCAFYGRQPYIANVATTALGFMYGGWLPCHLLFIKANGVR